jgi:hypothetical protein
MGYHPDTPVYIVLNNLFSQVVRKDFHLVRNYTVLATVDKTYGKWPRAFGSAIFLDSNFLYENTIEMVYSNAVNLVTRNNYNANVLLLVNNIYMFVRAYIKEKNITEAQYAMMVHLQLKDRMDKYLRD